MVELQSAMLVKEVPSEFAVTEAMIHSIPISIHTFKVHRIIVPCDYIAKLVTVKLLSRIVMLNSFYDIELSECKMTSLMISQHRPGNSSAPSGAKPLPGPMLTNLYEAMWRHNAPMKYFMKILPNFTCESYLQNFTMYAVLCEYLL